ncbi:hypothetical protein RJ640_007033 [Escallonia rubra]|uniref:Uncharacterized protein n=1 Tax=Escallonia rubra TaxID=112253 RepID=A0AA88QPN6_9ASTE|nr:hypothetical protein RJ640_007033 [Escallonia rubra]
MSGLPIQLRFHVEQPLALRSLSLTRRDLRHIFLLERIEDLYRAYVHRLALGLLLLLFLNQGSHLALSRAIPCPMRSSAKEAILFSIKDGFNEGKDLVGSVMSAMGEEQIFGLKDIGPTLTSY